MSRRNLDVEALVRNFSSDQLAEVETFLGVEKHIAAEMRDSLSVAPDGMNTLPIRNLILRRKSSHWVSASLRSVSDVPRDALRSVYDALVAACDLRDLSSSHRNLPKPYGRHCDLQSLRGNSVPI